MEEAAVNLPFWVQSAGVFIVTLIAAIIAVLKYVRTNISDDNGENDNKSLVKQIVVTLKEGDEDFIRYMKKLITSQEELQHSIDLNTKTNLDLLEVDRVLIKIIKEKDGKQEIF